MTAQAERRSNWTLAALAAPCLPLAGLGLPLVVYLPEYYANELGLSLGAVGMAFMLVRLLDMAFDPYIGGVMDRTLPGMVAKAPPFPKQDGANQ